MGKTQTSTERMPTIDELAITGTPEQIQRICSSWDKKEVSLKVTVNNKQLTYQRQTDKGVIKILLPDNIISSNGREWKGLNINLAFETKSKNAHKAVMPLIDNGMHVKFGQHFTLSKKRIIITNAST